MKKKMIALVVLVFAVAITSYSVSGTYAKYISEASVSDNARVARWGISLGSSQSETINLFKKQYGSGNEINASNSDDVIAPGSSGSIDFKVEFDESGAPEVAYTLSSEVKVTDLTQQLKFALVGPDSKLIGGSTYKGQAYANSLDYYELTAATLQTELAKALTGSSTEEGGKASQDHNANETLEDLVGTYTVYWMWDFNDQPEVGNAQNVKDTNLGNGKDAEGGENNYTDGAGEAATLSIKLTAAQKALS